MDNDFLLDEYTPDRMAWDAMSMINEYIDVFAQSEEYNQTFAKDLAVLTMAAAILEHHAGGKDGLH